MTGTGPESPARGDGFVNMVATEACLGGCPKSRPRLPVVDPGGRPGWGPEPMTVLAVIAGLQHPGLV